MTVKSKILVALPNRVRSAGVDLYAVGRQRDEDGKRKFVQINNYIKSLSFVMNGINLILLEKKKCWALFSNNS